MLYTVAMERIKITLCENNGLDMSYCEPITTRSWAERLTAWQHTAVFLSVRPSVCLSLCLRHRPTLNEYNVHSIALAPAAADRNYRRRSHEASPRRGSGEVTGKGGAEGKHRTRSRVKRQRKRRTICRLTSLSDYMQFSHCPELQTIASIDYCGHPCTTILTKARALVWTCIGRRTEVTYIRHILSVNWHLIQQNCWQEKVRQ